MKNTAKQGESVSKGSKINVCLKGADYCKITLARRDTAALKCSKENISDRTLESIGILEGF